MEIEEYSKLALRTAPSDTFSHRDLTAIAVLGLCGEAGEVAELFKKHYGHGHQLDLTKLTKELGDVLWYINRLGSLYGISLQEIAAVNIAKLATRYPNAFNSHDSINRID